MLVRIKYGWKAGQVQDIEPSAARAMLADGRASEVNYENGDAKPEGVAQLIQNTEDASEAEHQRRAFLLDPHHGNADPNTPENIDRLRAMGEPAVPSKVPTSAKKKR